MAQTPTGSGSAARDGEGRGVDVVALVTSAGGLEALSAVLRVLPRDFPAAVVLTQHLGGQGSALAEILDRRIALPVRWAREGGRVEPGTVTVCPPRSVLEVLPDRTYAVRPAEKVLAERPLDALLTSVGDSFGPASLAVVLTGMGGDGAAGASAVRAAGGRVIAQSEDTAEQPSMPAAAVAAGAVDLVLPLHEIGATLVDVVAGRRLPVPGYEAEAVRRTFGEHGEIARLAREIDWAATPLGAVSTWPEAQRAVTQLAMAAQYPVSLHLGAEHILLFNEAALPSMAGEYKRVFAVSSIESYPEVADYLLPVLAQARAGNPVRHETVKVPYVQGGRMLDAWFDGLYTAVCAADGTVLGVQQTYLNRTDEVLGRRRLQTLNRLAVLPTAPTRHAALEAAVGVLSSAEDVPFVAAYLLDPARSGASLVAVSGAEAGSAMAPHRLRLAPGAAWPLDRVVKEMSEVLLDDVAERFRGQRVTEERLSLEQAVLHPLRDQGADGGVVGIVILGVLPTVRLDDGYRGFLTLVGETVGAKVHEAHARQRERDRLRRLAELDRAKTDFFSNVSHEFRTPLTLMLGPLEELGRDGDGLSPQQRADVELVRRNARRLQRLVGTMLDFSQIEAGRLRATFAPVDLAERTREIVAQFESAARRAGVRLEVDLARLPEPVWVDVEMWEKIVSNLVSNALKFTFEGKVRVTLRALPQHAELVVHDTGVGIPQEELPHVFKRFHRVRGTRARTHEGAGIGLALVDELVRRHHGRVRVASTVGEGTTFTVWIPSRRRPVALDTAPPTDPPLQVAAAMAEEASSWGDAPAAELFADDWTARHELSGYAPAARILVVDDNQDMRDYLARLLAPHWELATAADGAQALALARRDPPELVLADVMMPGLDGFALLRELRNDADLSGIPVVLVTARAGEESAIEGLLAGADDYIVKPFSARELVARVAGQLELARARRGAFELNEFLVRFSDTARGLSEPGAVAETACRMMIERLQARRAAWAEIDHETQEYVADCIVLADGTRAEPSRWPLDPDDRFVSEHVAGRSVVYTDSTNDPRISPRAVGEMAKHGLRSGIAVPIYLEGEFHAVLSVSDPQPRLWTSDELALVEALAGRAWAEAERTRAEVALRERDRQTAADLKAITTLYELGKQCADPALDFSTGLQAVLDTAVAMVGADKGNIQVVDPVSGTLKIAVQHGFEAPFLEFFAAVEAKDSAVCAQAFATRSRVVVEDVRQSKLFAGQPSLDVLLAAGVRAVQSAPLISPDGRVFGMISTHFAAPRKPAERELRMMDLVVRQAADYLERRKAEAALRESEERQAFLLKLSDALRPLGDPAAVRTTAARLLGEQLGANRCLYAEVDGDEWLIEDAFGRDVPPLPPGRYDIAQFGQWIIDRHRAGELHVFDDLSSDERFDSAQRDAHAALSIHAGIAVPLVKDGTLVAVLTVHRAAPHQWTEREISLAVETAERTWAAVERARSERALRQRQH
ncbi:chemotaxis protein CheB [Actinoplanes sp. CA-030573]|uniref:chemotaxis protein CheB n=1 Tax=Actinoplanes sp. CA-030573 TaxID=3239898 RepID=UPI003D939E19